MAERHDVQRKVLEEPGLAELRLEHRGGEGRGIDGDAAEPRPKIDHGAEMILMRVGQEQALEVRALGLEEGDVGKDHVDAGLGVAAKGDAHVDDEPFAVVRRPVAVEVEVHADLAHAANGDEHELRPLSVGTAGHALTRAWGLTRSGEKHVAGGDAALGTIAHQEPERTP